MILANLKEDFAHLFVVSKFKVTAWLFKIRVREK